MAYTKPSNINSLWAATGTKVPPDSSKRSLGWIAEKPSWQYFNSVLNRIDTIIAYINERGIVEWDNVTEYQANKSYVVGSDGNIYASIVTGSGINPTTDDGTNWLQVWNDQGVVKWNLSTAYTESAIVRYTDGENYICHTPQATGTLPTDHSAFINLKFYGAYAYVVSQLAGGAASSVGFIYEGQTVDSYDYLVYPGDGRIYSRGLVTGTTSGAFNPIDGTATGLTGALVNKSIDELDGRVDVAEADITELSTANNARTKAALNAGGLAPIFAARTWINFDGTGVISIRDSGNVLSISDIGTGLYDVTLIEAVDINSSLWTNGTVSSGGANCQVVKANMTSETTIRVRCVTAANNDTDLEYVMVGVIG